MRDLAKKLRLGPGIGKVIFVVFFAVVGVASLVFIRAATPNTSFEAEDATIGGCASKVSNSEASGGSAVEFGCNSTNNPLGLDPNGATIPAVYPVPSTGVIFMASNGNDANAGTSEAAPVKTIARAMAAVASGGTIVVRAGVYRDNYMPVVYDSVNQYYKIQLSSKVFNVQSYPNEQVWFDGTDIAPTNSWRNEGNGRWSIAWETPEFCHHYQTARTGGYYTQIWPWQGTPGSTGPCIHPDMALGTDVDADPQMVFINDANLAQVRTESAVAANSFYNDTVNKRIYIGTDPAGKTVEITKRAAVFGLQGGAGGNKVRGLGFRKFATQERQEGSYTYGVFMVNVPNVTVENSVFTRNAGGAVMFANARGAVVNKTVFVNNGYTALMINGSTQSGLLDNTQLTNSIFKSNNVALFGSGCTSSCSAAGSKWAHMNSYTLKNNLFEDQKAGASGFWCDLDCRNGVHVNNIFRNNGGHGVYYEVSNTGVIASNLVYGNRRSGIKVSAANTRVYNNTIVGNNIVGESQSGGMLIYDDDRYPGAPGTGHKTGGVWDDVGPSTVNVELYNNVLVNNTFASIVSWRISDDPNNTGPNTFYSGYNYNSYFRSGTAVPVSSWQDPFRTTVPYSTVALLFAAKGKEANGQDITDGSNPFVNMAGGDYSIKEGSTTGGQSLPADIAQMIGVPTTTKRGALRWWPNGL